MHSACQVLGVISRLVLHSQRHPHPYHLRHTLQPHATHLGCVSAGGIGVVVLLPGGFCSRLLCKALLVDTMISCTS
jgi:hypothetical protein